MTLDSNDVQYPSPDVFDRAKVASYGQKVADALAEQYDELLKNHTTKASITISELQNELINTRNQVKELQRSNANYRAESAELHKKIETFKLSIDQKNNALASVTKERDDFKEIAQLFTVDEVQFGHDRKAKQKEKLAENARKLMAREAAAAEIIRKENEAKWAAENKAKEDKKAAEEQAKADADALVKSENSAREEARLLRAELLDLEPEKMSDLYHGRELYEGTWAERLAFLKFKAQNWETERQSAQKAQPVTEERHEPGSNLRDDYESPSPF